MWIFITLFAAGCQVYCERAYQKRSPREAGFYMPPYLALVFVCPGECVSCAVWQLFGWVSCRKKSDFLVRPHLCHRAKVMATLFHVTSVFSPVSFCFGTCCLKKLSVLAAVNCFAFYFTIR